MTHTVVFQDPEGLPQPAGLAAEGGPPPDADALRIFVAEVLDVAPGVITDDDNLIALGLDSVKAMVLSTRLRRSGVRLRFAEMLSEPTLAAWSRLLATAGGADPGQHT